MYIQVHHSPVRNSPLHCKHYQCCRKPYPCRLCPAVVEQCLDVPDAVSELHRALPGAGRQCPGSSKLCLPPLDPSNSKPCPVDAHAIVSPVKNNYYSPHKCDH